MTLAAAMVAGPALAADLMQPPEVTPAMMSPSPIVGYVDLHVGGEQYDENYSDGTDSYSYFNFGGMGAAAIQLDPSLSTQFDAWSNTSNETDSSGDSYTYTGIAGHLTWHTGPGTEVGVMGSIGTDGDGLNGTVAVEGATNIDNFRLYGQAGVVHGLTGYDAEYDESQLYAAVEGDYFVNPDLMLSGNIGASTETENDEDNYSALSWGLKAEFKPQGSPVSFYGAYQGIRYADDSSSDYTSVDNVFAVGIRVPFGAGSIEDLQNAVGLSDMNPDYGALLAH